MNVQLQNVLKRELKSHKITVNALSKSCGIPVSVLHGWVQGVLPSAKNLHHIASLAKYFGLPVSVLLFDKEESSVEPKILFNSEFADGNLRYRLSIEKIEGEDK